MLYSLELTHSGSNTSKRSKVIHQNQYAEEIINKSLGCAGPRRQLRRGQRGVSQQLNVQMSFLRRLHRERIVPHDGKEHVIRYLVEMRRQIILDDNKDNMKEGRL